MSNPFEFDKEDDQKNVTARGVDDGGEKPRKRVVQNPWTQHHPVFAGVGLFAGAITISLGTRVLKEVSFEASLFAVFLGIAFWIFGCIHLCWAKGISGWFALFGFCMIPGLIVIAIIQPPKKKKRKVVDDDWEYRRFVRKPNEKKSDDNSTEKDTR